MKKSGRKQILALGLLFIAVLGCKSFKALTNPTVVTSADGKFQLTVPAGWSKTTELNDKGDIQAANKLEELYVVVLIEAQEDFSTNITLDDFTDITRKSLMSNYQSPQATSLESISINGNEARQYELSGTTATTAVVLLVTTVKTSSHYHQILAWTLRSKMHQNRDTLKQVVATFRPTS